MEQNAELGAFLRTRRARLSPQEAGLSPGGGVRRVPGLRREEVAYLGGVSTDYYIRLEQGRHPNVSEAVLDSVARALRLDDDERAHLFDLARTRTARSRSARPERVQRVRPDVHQMLDIFNGVSPAFVANHRQDVLAANQLARALITDWGALPYRERNFARYVLLNPAARTLYRNWDEVAEIVVANLRLEAGRHPDDALLNELLGEAVVKVPEFSTWWDSHRVAQCVHGTQHFHHPVVGEFTLHHETLALPADPDQAMCVYTAEPGSASAQALALLASWSAPDATRGDNATDAPRPGSAIRPE
ncbi:helix-turn-helix transcriptional regulator [Streptomyces sp. NBC_00365]|uniref:helix-turn-helix transcriptional regulator n=1 Tax=unclassified Streptomyces TaxID=2593676 RepID=UPI0022589287|nr:MULTISPECIES: helix-turn-helix transcriptional regulator [unclassified Streptomyces]MCX5095836.1 helix-turn-helix transcriptional regulator [Streptomyces sp. NBC_00365]